MTLQARITHEENSLRDWIGFIHEKLQAGNAPETLTFAFDVIAGQRERIAAWRRKMVKHGA